MFATRTISGLAVMSLLVSGCAATQSRFIDSSYSLDDTKVCRNYIKDQAKLRFSYQPEDADERRYIDALRTQEERRNLSISGCEAKVKEATDKIVGGVLLGVLAVGAAAAATNSGGGYSNSYSGNSGHAWDLIDGPYGGTIWRCRDKSNGQFANDYKCSGKYKNDYTWPGT